MRNFKNMNEVDSPGITKDEAYVYDREAKIVLSKIYEDDEVIVIIAPNEPQLKNIIVNLLQKQPMTIKELHEILSGLASEDKIRHALNELLEEGLVHSKEDGRYFAATGPFE